eukprot:Em0014g607a
MADNDTAPTVTCVSPSGTAPTSANESHEERRVTPVRSRAVSAAFKRLATSMVPPEPVLSAIKPPMNRQAWLRFLLTHIPILHWTWTYKLKYLVPDIISGLTVAVVHIPQGLAYALLATMDPVYGLYTSLVPVIVYSVMGSSRHISLGTVSLVSLMVGSAINQVFSERGLDFCTDEDMGSAFIDNESNLTCGELKVQVAVSMAFTSGLMMLVMGCFQMGFVSIFLSEPLVSGYTTGVAILVFTSQVSHIFGIKLTIHPLISRFPDILNFPRMWVEVFRQVFNWPHYVNTGAFVISLISIVLLFVFKVINEKLLPKVKCSCKLWWSTARTFKWPIPIPSQIFMVIIGIAFSAGLGLHEKYHIPVVGKVPSSLPPLTFPKGDLMIATLSNAFAISIVTYVFGASLAQVLAKKHDYTISSNQEFISYGLCNIAGAFFSSFNSASCFSRTLVQVSAGGKTQLVGLISSAVIAVVLVLMGFVFEQLPRAVLASIIWVALYGMFLQFKDVWKYFKISFSDTILWLVAFVATVLLGADLGLLVGVASAVVVIVCKTALPNYEVLKQSEDDPGSLRPLGKDAGSAGIIVYQFRGPLCFVNISVFQKRLKLAVHVENNSEDSEGDGCLKTLAMKIGGLFGKRGADGLGGYKYSRSRDDDEVQELRLEEASEQAERGSAVAENEPPAVESTAKLPTNVIVMCSESSGITYDCPLTVLPLVLWTLLEHKLYFR